MGPQHTEDSRPPSDSTDVQMGREGAGVEEEALG